MRALCVAECQLTLRQDMPVPVPGAGEVLIRPLLAGVCNTDLELAAGYYGYQGIPGHEFVGTVVEGPAAWRGKRVVGEINIACEKCDLCLAGVPSQCRDRRTLGIRDYAGVFADYFVLPLRNLVEVPETLTDEQAVFTEPLAAACQVLEMAHVRPSDRVVLIGAGKLGMLTAQALRLSGAALTVVVRHDHQARLLAGWGIPTARIEELPLRQADTVVDCTGNESGFAAAMSLLRPRGTLVLKSTFHGRPQVDLSSLVVQEFTVIGSRCGPFDAALRLLTANLVEVEPLIHGRFSLEESVAAVEYSARPGTLKVLLTFDLP
jgi:threonine dehydrogenase-like Zn-dependent dehydrogenase